LRLELQQLGFAERLVHDAHARPEQHFAPELAAEIAAQMPVGAEDDFLVLGDLARIVSALLLVTMMSTAPSPRSSS
jgi:hypothetical protein